MRHPFWRWTGWISLSMAGCLHGNDARHATTRTVADNTETRTVAPVIGPLRKPAAPPTTTTQPEKRWSKLFSRSATAPTPLAAPAAPTVPAVPASPVPAPVAGAAPPSVSHVIPAQHTVSKDTPRPQPAAVAAPSPATTPHQPALLPETQARPLTPSAAAPAMAPAERPVVAAAPSNEPRPFAEFQRAIPLNPVDVAKPLSVPRPAHIEIRPLFAPSTAVNIVPMPLASPEKQTPSEKISDPTQESPNVSDTATATRAAESSARPREVARLIDEVFEDLRLHRISEARARTERLKRLVEHGTDEPQISEPQISEPQISEPQIDEPQADELPAPGNTANLIAPPEPLTPINATSAADADPDKFFDDEEPLRD